jgi:epoxyqueuosine reductase
MGKHTNVLTKQVGSYYFIAELIVDLDLEYDMPVTDHCGSCTACIDACPTQAIVEPYVVDGSKCISYLTIELKNSIPTHFSGMMDDWMFGCDVCQDVCPWNRFSKSHKEPLFNANPKLLAMSKKEWEEVSEEVFHEIFNKSAVKRTKYSGLQRNINFIKDK